MDDSKKKKSKHGEMLIQIGSSSGFSGEKSQE